MRMQSTSAPNNSAFPVRKALKYAALTTVVVGGTIFTCVYSFSYHLTSVFYLREFLSDEEVQQYHSLDQNLLGDEHTLLINAVSKYSSILARYKTYMEPFQTSREPHFTVGHIEEMNEYVVQKTLDYTDAILLGDYEERMTAILLFLSVMLTAQEMDVLRRKYHHIPIWDEIEEDNVEFSNGRGYDEGEHS